MTLEKELKAYEAQLTKELEAERDAVLTRASEIKGRSVSTSSLHGLIGGKNNTFVDSIRDRFQDPQEFVAAWISGLMSNVRKIEDEQRSQYNGNIYQNTATHDVLRLVQDDIVGAYTIKFLTRNFYRNFIARTREKPAEELWQVWFGEGTLVWGLLISPAFRKSEWTNDKSEMRRAGYAYWTVGHILETGIIDPEHSDPVKFETLDKFIEFYRSVLKRSAVSQYERGIADYYIEYLKNSKDPKSEPFLIPEFRYAGRAKKHLYRLDFTVLNAHTMEKIGFELSPSSTHYAVSKMKDKTQKTVNEELSANWTKEIEKRNAYFEEYGISIITFTDHHLKNLDTCFDKIREVLARRPAMTTSLMDAFEDLRSFTID